MKCSQCERETSEDGAHGTATDKNVTAVLCAFCALEAGAKEFGLEGATQKIVVGAIGKMFQLFTGQGKTETRFGDTFAAGLYEKSLELQEKRKKKDAD